MAGDALFSARRPAAVGALRYPPSTLFGPIDLVITDGKELAFALGAHLGICPECLLPCEIPTHERTYHRKAGMSSNDSVSRTPFGRDCVAHAIMDQTPRLALTSGVIPRRDALTRLLSKMRIDEATSCWEWHGAIDAKGYGRFGYQGRNRLAYNVSYELLVGPIPEGLTLDHLCRNRACVNPSHLEPVTNEENLRRGRWPHNRFKTHCVHGHPLPPSDGSYRVCEPCRQRRLAEARSRRAANPSQPKTHCVNGHAFDQRNTYLTSEGHRVCRPCRADAQARRRARRRAA